jgi:transcriptional regulator with XRE-family HTH domain
MEIGEIVKKLRVRKQITQKQLADKVKITSDSVHRYENDYADRIPSDKLIDIAKALDTTVAKLYQYKESPNLLEDQNNFYGQKSINEVTLSVKLDGTLETLNELYNTLKKVNAAIA